MLGFALESEGGAVGSVAGTQRQNSKSVKNKTVFGSNNPTNEGGWRGDSGVSESHRLLELSIVWLDSFNVRAQYVVT